MEEVTILQILQTVHPGQQAAYQKAIAIDQAFSWIPEERVLLYAEHLKQLDELIQHGEANFSGQVRGGKLINKEYSKRYI